MKDLFKAFGIAGLIIVGLYTISWLITCGIIFLICCCFDLTFKWSIATGIWLVMCLMKKVFQHNTTIKK